MKKIILAMAISAFSFSAHAETTSACINVSASLSTMTESQILNSLTEAGCGMSLQEAVDAVVAAGGDLTTTQTAALNIDPNFVYTDPTAGLDATAAGGDGLGGPTGNTNPITFNAPSGGSGGGGVI